MDYTYLYIFFSIDGTFSKRLGRYVNDSPPAYCNARIKPVYCDQQLHLCLFLLVDKIEAGTELRYSYGEIGLPWRKVNLFQYFIVNKSTGADLT